jgi:murein DD-endopeptidase MepM/ murein hydrolase activator NlpD
MQSHNPTSPKSPNNPLGRPISLADKAFARLFKLAAGLDYTIAVQWNSRTRSHFSPWKRSVTHAVLGVLCVAVLGLGCLVIETGIFTYRKVTLAYETRQHNALKARLHAVSTKQKGYETQLDSLRYTEMRLRALYGMNAGQSLMPFGIGGYRPKKVSAQPSEKDLHNHLFEASLKSQKLRSQLQFSANTLDNIQDFIRYRQKIWDHTPSVAPARGQLSSGFGYRVHPVTGSYSRHEGLDIVGDTWTPIYATASGIVSFAGHSGFYGNCVDLDHGNGYMTRFGHMSRLTVTKGQIIKRFDLIGYMGRTGRATGTHLHYEVHRDGSPIDPTRFILPSGLVVD